MSGRAGQGPVQILTVDDYVPFLQAARRVISAAPGFESAGEFSTAAGALAAIEAREPQLALIDVHMPETGGVEVTRQIRAAHPAVLVVLISAKGPDQLPVAVHECGAAAIMRKQDLTPRFLRELWGDLRPR